MTNPRSASDDPESDSRALRRVTVERRDGDGGQEDWLAVEEPLEIRVDGESLVVTLRTPGHDRELAVGFLFSEGVLKTPTDLESVEVCSDPLAYDPDNVVDVGLSSSAAAERQAIDNARREYLAAAACGLCGKARIEAIYQRLPTIAAHEPPPVELLRRLPELMEERQALFTKTGGLHGAALFDRDGRLLDLAEDVGRHNAVDKLIGAAFLRDDLPWTGRVLVVSARAGFEIVQKAMMAGTSTLVAVGAASSLAAEAALKGSMELFSFVRPGRSNRHLRVHGP